MSVDLTADEALSFTGLVTLEEDLESYVLEWPSVPDSDGASEAIALVVLKRTGGFLLALPPGLVPEAVLRRANAGQEAGSIGASTSVLVQGVIVENGIRSPAGALLEVVLVDVSADLVSQMRPHKSSRRHYCIAFRPRVTFHTAGTSRGASSCQRMGRRSWRGMRA